MVQSFRPIAGQQSLSEIAYKEIRAAIVQGRLQSGQRLVYRTIAEEFGISPTPIRDAIQRLVSDGALVLDDRGVAHVPVMDPDTYREILSLRIQLEGNAAAEVARNVSTGDDIIETLSATHERLATHKRDKNIELALVENEQFHSQLIRAAHMPVLEELVRSLWLRCGPSLRLLYGDSFKELDVHPHLLVIDALKRGDPEAARAAIESDLQYGGLHILEHIEAITSENEGRA